MSKLIGLTLHYEDGTVQKVRADGIQMVIGGQSKHTYLDADECPIHGKWMAMPGGTSKDGRTYGPFWTCDVARGEARCSNKPSKAWVETHPPERALPVSSADDFMDVPF